METLATCAATFKGPSLTRVCKFMQPIMNLPTSVAHNYIILYMFRRSDSWGNLYRCCQMPTLPHQQVQQGPSLRHQQDHEILRKYAVTLVSIIWQCIGWPGSREKPSLLNDNKGDPLTKAAITSYMSTMLAGRWLHKERPFMYEQMGTFFDLVQKKQLEACAERQLYCRLYMMVANG